MPTAPGCGCMGGSTRLPGWPAQHLLKAPPLAPPLSCSCAACTTPPLTCSCTACTAGPQEQGQRAAQAAGRRRRLARCVAQLPCSCHCQGHLQRGRGGHGSQLLTGRAAEPCGPMFGAAVHAHAKPAQAFLPFSCTASPAPFPFPSTDALFQLELKKYDDLVMEVRHGAAGTACTAAVLASAHCTLHRFTRRLQHAPMPPHLPAALPAQHTVLRHAAP